MVLQNVTSALPFESRMMPPKPVELVVVLRVSSQLTFTNGSSGTTQFFVVVVRLVCGRPQSSHKLAIWKVSSCNFAVVNTC